jgi:hypothetical protein
MNTQPNSDQTIQTIIDELSGLPLLDKIAVLLFVLRLYTRRWIADIPRRWAMWQLGGHHE